MGRPKGQRTYPIRVGEDAYRAVKTIKDEAKRQGQILTATDIIARGVGRMVYRGSEDDVTASSKHEERMIKKLLRVMRQPGSPAVRQAIVRIIEDLLDSRTARGAAKE